MEGRAQVPQCQLLCEHRALMEAPHVFEDCTNNDYEHDFEKTKEAEKRMVTDSLEFSNIAGIRLKKITL